MDASDLDMIERVFVLLWYLLPFLVFFTVASAVCEWRERKRDEIQPMARRKSS